MKYLKTFENKEPEKKVKYYSNNNIRSISYKLDNKYHNENGPAYQRWYKNGKQSTELYIINGIFHREDGPAETIYFKNGELVKKSYYFNNIEYDREDWINKLKEINSPHYKEQKMLYDIEKYNL